MFGLVGSELFFFGYLDFGLEALLLGFVWVLFIIVVVIIVYVVVVGNVCND